MTRKEKKEAIRNLIKKGAVDCAKVCAYDWHLIRFYNKVINE